MFARILTRTADPDSIFGTPYWYLVYREEQESFAEPEYLLICSVGLSRIESFRELHKSLRPMCNGYSWVVKPLSEMLSNLLTEMQDQVGTEAWRELGQLAVEESFISNNLSMSSL